MSHANAPLTPEGRRRLCVRVDSGRPICHVAAEAGVSRQTLGKWYSRWQESGEDGLHDHSSKPWSSPNRTDSKTEEAVVAMRRDRKVGPVQLAGLLRDEKNINLPVSTIYRILVRHGVSRVRDLDVSGEDLREPVVRYEHASPGDMIHVDVKKLGRIPDGGGWRAHGMDSEQFRAARRAKAKQPKQKTGRIGYIYMHSAMDDNSRLTYTEELPDEKGVTAAAFWLRAVAFFKAHGITKIHRVLTDNGSCYRSAAFNFAAAATGTRHKYTRPYRPQTNGKIERFHRTLAREWAYSQAWTSNEERTAALQAFLDRYNYRRPHTALGGLPPISRCPADNNLAA